MADEVTTTKKASKEVDHASAINAALDKAKEAMIASGMPEGDAEAFLNSARPRGIGAVVGGIQDMQALGGHAQVTIPVVEEDRLHFAHKIPKE